MEKLIIKLWMIGFIIIFLGFVVLGVLAQDFNWNFVFPSEQPVSSNTNREIIIKLWEIDSLDFAKEYGYDPELIQGYIRQVERGLKLEASDSEKKVRNDFYGFWKKSNQETRLKYWRAMDEKGKKELYDLLNKDQANSQRANKNRELLFEALASDPDISSEDLKIAWNLTEEGSDPFGDSTVYRKELMQKLTTQQNARMLSEVSEKHIDFKIVDKDGNSIPLEEKVELEYKENNNFRRVIARINGQEHIIPLDPLSEFDSVNLVKNEKGEYYVAYKRKDGNYVVANAGTYYESVKDVDGKEIPGKIAFKGLKDKNGNPIEAIIPSLSGIVEGSETGIKTWGAQVDLKSQNGILFTVYSEKGESSSLDILDNLNLFTVQGRIKLTEKKQDGIKQQISFNFKTMTTFSLDKDREYVPKSPSEPVVYYYDEDEDGIGRIAIRDPNSEIELEISGKDKTYYKYDSESNQWVRRDSEVKHETENGRPIVSAGENPMNPNVAETLSNADRQGDTGGFSVSTPETRTESQGYKEYQKKYLKNILRNNGFTNINENSEGYDLSLAGLGNSRLAWKAERDGKIFEIAAGEDGFLYLWSGSEKRWLAENQGVPKHEAAWLDRYAQRFADGNLFDRPNYYESYEYNGMNENKQPIWKKVCYTKTLPKTKVDCP